MLSLSLLLAELALGLVASVTGEVAESLLSLASDGLELGVAGGGLVGHYESLCRV